jgi:hypothetical protein
MILALSASIPHAFRNTFFSVIVMSPAQREGVLNPPSSGFLSGSFPDPNAFAIAQGRKLELQPDVHKSQPSCARTVPGSW